MRRPSIYGKYLKDVQATRTGPNIIAQYGSNYGARFLTVPASQTIARAIAKDRLANGHPKI